MVLPRDSADASNPGKRQVWVYVTSKFSQLTQAALSENDDPLKLFTQYSDKIWDHSSDLIRQGQCQVQTEDIIPGNILRDFTKNSKYMEDSIYVC